MHARGLRTRGGPGAPVTVLVLGLLVLLAACSTGPAVPRAAGRSAATSPSARTSGDPGASGAPPAAWRVVALGDSVTSGGPCGCTPFPQLYAHDLAEVRGARVSVRNLGVGGLDSGGLLHSLTAPGSGVAAAVRGSDIVLLTIGANDFADQHGSVTDGRCLAGPGTDCVQDDLQGMRRNVTAVLEEIRRLRGGRPTAVLVTGYWNVFEDGAVARDSFPDLGVRATRVLTRLANRWLRADALAAGATYVDLFAPFNGPASRGDLTRLLAADGDHPNQAGQALIARRLLAAGLPGLAQG